MYSHKLSEYDIQQLEQARQIICNVYCYHYGDSYMRKEVNRLETILNKIDTLLKAL